MSVSNACLYSTSHDHACGGWTRRTGKPARKCTCDCHKGCKCPDPIPARFHCLRCGKLAPNPQPTAKLHTTDPPLPF